MDRLEYIRTKIDRILGNMKEEERKFAYIHLYGVSQIAALLALKRKEDVEICSLAAMLHDISYYEDGIYEDHAQRSARRSKEILTQSEEFSEEEIRKICVAIGHHSMKSSKHAPFDELLKDSDVLAHYLYNIQVPIPEKDKVRLYYVLEEMK